MSTPWQISTGGVERVELEDGHAEITLTVSNPGPVDDQAVVEVVPGEGARRDWFTVTDPQRRVPHGRSETVPVEVRPAEDAPPGSYWFAGRVYSADTAPEENSTESNRVAFEIAGRAAPKSTPRWLWVIIAVFLVAVVAAVVAFVALRGDGDEVPAPALVTVPLVAGEQAVAAAITVQQAGLSVVFTERRSRSVPQNRVIETLPPAGDEVPEGSDVTIVVSSGRIVTCPPWLCPPTFTPPTVATPVP